MGFVALSVLSAGMLGWEERLCRKPILEDLQEAATDHSFSSLGLQRGSTLHQSALVLSCYLLRAREIELQKKCHPHG